MQGPTHHTAQPKNVQPKIIETSWDEEIVPSLPANLVEKARDLKAFVRKGKIPTPQVLLRALLVYAICGFSYKALGAWALLMDIADLSDTAWQKRLVSSSAWLFWILSELLTVANKLDVTGDVDILLIDASVFRQMGGDGDDWRLHTVYSLRQGRIVQLSLTDKYSGEGIQHISLRAGVIVVGDRAYGYRRSFAEIIKHNAHGVFRFHPNTLPLETMEGTRMDMMQELKQHEEGFDRLVQITHDGEQYVIRVIVMPLPQAEAEKARRKLRRDAQRKGRQVTKERLKYAGYLFIATTLRAEQWSRTEVVQFYRARWQIELIFKRIKQIIRVHTIRAKKREAVEATIRAILVAWVLQEGVKEDLRQQLTAVHAQPPESHLLLVGLSSDYVSSWTLTALCVQTLRMQVQGGWNFARIRACLPRLRRHMCSRSRKRSQQETEIREWIEQKVLALSSPQQKAA